MLEMVSLSGEGDRVMRATFLLYITRIARTADSWKSVTSCDSVRQHVIKKCESRFPSPSNFENNSKQTELL